MGTVKLKDFRPAVLALQTEALAKLRDIAQGKLHETYWRTYEQQLREAGRLLQVIDANPDAAIASPSAPVGVDDIAVELEYYANCPGRVLVLAGKLRALAQQPAGFSAGDMADASAQGFRAGAESVQRPAAVGEAMARRLDDYLDVEFDIRIGKQAAHAALTAALAAQQGGGTDE